MVGRGGCWSLSLTQQPEGSFSKKYFTYLFLAALGLSCDTRDLPLGYADFLLAVVQRASFEL